MLIENGHFCFTGSTPFSAEAAFLVAANERYRLRCEKMWREGKVVTSIILSSPVKLHEITVT